MELTVIAVFVAFLLVNLLVGLYTGRNVRTLSNYSIADRSLSTGTLILTITATIIGAGYVASFIRTGSMVKPMTVCIDLLSVLIMSIACGWYIYPKLWEFKGCHTLGDIIGKVYGKHAQIILGIIAVVISIILLNAQLVAVAELKDLLGLQWISSKYILVSTVGIVLILYTVTGGIRAVASTDVVQLSLILGGMGFISYKIMVSDVAGIPIHSLSNLWYKVQSHLSTLGIPSDWESIIQPPDLPRQIHYMLFYGMLVLSNPVMSRALMARDKKQIKDSFSGLMSIYVLLSLMGFIVGMGLFIFHGEIIQDDRKVISVLTRYVSIGNSTVTVWGKCLVFLMLLAVIMSTADSFLNSAVIIIIKDIALPLYKKPIKNELRWIQLATTAIGFLSLVIALFCIGRNPVKIVIFGQSLLCISILPILGIVIGFKKSEKALLKGIGFFLLVIFSAILVAKYADFSLSGIDWLTNIGFLGQYLVIYPYAILLSCLVYVLFESIVHNGLKWEEHVRFKKEGNPGVLQIGWREVKRLWKDPLGWTEEKVDLFGSRRPVLLALFCIFTFLTSIFVGRPVSEVYMGNITLLMLSVFTVCVLLLMHEQMYGLLKQYYALFWMVSVIFCLPFAFCLHWLYQPTTVTSFYLVLVPFLMHSLMGVSLGMVLSALGYIMAFGVWKLTYDPSIVTPDKFITLLGLGFTTALAWVAWTYPMKLSLERVKRSKLWASSWGHDLNHLFMETQMEVDERFNPLPKEKEERLQAYEKRMSAIAKHVKSATSQSQAFRQLIIQDNIRPSEIVSMSLAEVSKHVYATLKSDFQDIVRIKGKGDIRVRVFLPIFTNIITNLIRNAWKAGASKIEITWDEKEPVLYIKDNGPGISKEMLPDLFEMKPSREGSGIGLPFIKEALYKMGALIDVESGSEGSVFMIFLEGTESSFAK